MSLPKMQTATVIKPKILHRNQLLAVFFVAYCMRFSYQLNWTRWPVIGLNYDTAEEMAESERLETKTLKFCNNSEYPVDMSKSKNMKTKDRQRISKRLKIHSKKLLL